MLDIDKSPSIFRVSGGRELMISSMVVGERGGGSGMNVDVK